MLAVRNVIFGISSTAFVATATSCLNSAYLPILSWEKVWYSGAPANTPPPYNLTQQINTTKTGMCKENFFKVVLNSKHTVKYIYIYVSFLNVQKEDKKVNNLNSPSQNYLVQTLWVCVWRSHLCQEHPQKEKKEGTLLRGWVARYHSTYPTQKHWFEFYHYEIGI